MYQLLEVAKFTKFTNMLKSKKKVKKSYGSQLSQNHGQPPSRKKKKYNFKKAEKRLGTMY